MQNQKDDVNFDNYLNIDEDLTDENICSKKLTTKNRSESQSLFNATSDRKQNVE